MLAPLVVFWLAAAPRDASQRVAGWAERRGFQALAAASSAQPAYDESAALEIEALLEDARTLQQSSSASFQRLDQLLAEHADLPQAAWWLAERYVLEAQLLEAGALDPERARALSGLGSGLEGTRAPAVGATPPPPPPPTQPAGSLRLVDLRPRDELLLDGKPVVAGAAVAPGRHHVQLFRAQRRVWASWVELADPPLLRVTDPTPACSELDLWGTQRGAHGPVAAPGVACETWAVASPGANGIELALCHGASCEGWQHLPAAGQDARAELEAARSPVPAWVTWGALGLGAAAGAALVLWQTGVFERPAPSTEFVFTGPTAAALRF